MNATCQRTVGELVAERPTRSRIFERLGIDYCCGGKRRLEDVCNEKGLDANTVGMMLEAFDASSNTTENIDWRQASLKSLCDNIETAHHAYLKAELPQLQALVNKVATVHGREHQELVRVAEVFHGFRGELEQHMQKEEMVLFPYIRQLEESKGMPNFHCGSTANPIEVMEHEHDQAGHALQVMRQLLSDYRVPDGACNSYRAMLERLAHLEEDMHVHVHKENSILFPRTLALETQKCSSHGGAQ